MDQESLRDLLVLQQHFLKSLQEGNPMFNRAIVQNANTQQKQTLISIFHYILSGEIPVEKESSEKLKSFSTLLQKVKKYFGSKENFLKYFENPDEATKVLVKMSPTYPYFLFPIFYKLE